MTMTRRELGEDSETDREVDALLVKLDGPRVQYEVSAWMGASWGDVDLSIEGKKIRLSAAEALRLAETLISAVRDGSAVRDPR